MPRMLVTDQVTLARTSSSWKVVGPIPPGLPVNAAKMVTGAVLTTTDPMTGLLLAVCDNAGNAHGFGQVKHDLTYTADGDLCSTMPATAHTAVSSRPLSVGL